jgi:hypothetical protein
MEAMRKEIARLNEIIGKGCLSGKAQASDKKENDSKVPKFKQGRHPSIKHGLGHTARAKTNERKIINGYECVKFERKGKFGTDRPAQIAIVPHPRVAVLHNGSATVKGSSAAPRKNGKATNFVPNQTKPKKKVSQQKQAQQKPKELVWDTMNKYAYQPKAQQLWQSLTSCFVLRSNSSGKVVTKYVGKETNVYKNTSIWVSKILVTNMQDPKSSWGPKSSN